MSKILTVAERQALKELSLDHEQFLVRGHFISKISTEVLEGLVALGLVEKTPAAEGRDIGWRITSDGWRCMYGKTIDEIMTGDKTIFPLPVWRWPPD
jgi:hypothetical protein